LLSALSCRQSKIRFDAAGKGSISPGLRRNG
jgi:hypothetical protein